MAVLVKFEKDWADEFDVENFYARKGVTVEQETEQLQKELARGEYRGFGSNEGWEPEEQSIDDYKVTKISDEEFDVLHKLFNGRKPNYVAFGTGIY